MKHLLKCILFLFVILFFEAKGQTPEFDWIKSLPFNPNTISTDSNGDVIIAGNIYMNIFYENHKIIHHGDGDIILAKYNKHGIFQWMKHLYSNRDEYCNEIHIDNNKNVIIGISCNYVLYVENDTIEFNYGGHNSLIMKLNNYGTILWSKVPGENDSGCFHTYTCDLDADANIIISGNYGSNYPGTVYFQNLSIPSLGGFSYIAKYDSDCNIIWVKDSLIFIDQICVNSDNSIFSVEPPEVNTNCYNSIKKRSALGQLIWELPFDVSISVYPSWPRMGTDKYGNTYLSFEYRDTLIINGTVFYSYPDRDILTIKINANGGLEWAKSISGPRNELIESLYVNKDDEILITAHISSGSVLGDTIYNSNFKKKGIPIVVKYDALGNVIFSKKIESFIYMQPELICEDNGIFITGVMRSDQEISELEHGSYSEFFLAKLSYPENNTILAQDHVDINIYPIPANNLIIIESHINNKTCKIQIFNTQGDILRELHWKKYILGWNCDFR